MIPSFLTRVEKQPDRPDQYQDYTKPICDTDAAGWRRRILCRRRPLPARVAQRQFRAGRRPRAGGSARPARFQFLDPGAQQFVFFPKRVRFRFRRVRSPLRRFRYLIGHVAIAAQPSVFRLEFRHGRQRGRGRLGWFGRFRPPLPLARSLDNLRPDARCLFLRHAALFPVRASCGAFGYFRSTSSPRLFQSSKSVQSTMNAAGNRTANHSGHDISNRGPFARARSRSSSFRIRASTKLAPQCSGLKGDSPITGLGLRTKGRGGFTSPSTIRAHVAAARTSNSKSSSIAAAYSSPYVRTSASLLRTIPPKSAATIAHIRASCGSPRFHSPGAARRFRARGGADVDGADVDGGGAAGATGLGAGSGSAGPAGAGAAAGRFPRNQPKNPARASFRSIRALSYESRPARRDRRRPLRSLARRCVARVSAPRPGTARACARRPPAAPHEQPAIVPCQELSVQTPALHPSRPESPRPLRPGTARACARRPPAARTACHRSLSRTVSPDSRVASAAARIAASSSAVHARPRPVVCPFSRIRRRSSTLTPGAAASGRITLFPFSRFHPARQLFDEQPELHAGVSARV